MPEFDVEILTDSSIYNIKVVSVNCREEALKYVENAITEGRTLIETDGSLIKLYNTEIKHIRISSKCKIIQAAINRIDEEFAVLELNEFSYADKYIYISKNFIPEGAEEGNIINLTIAINKDKPLFKEG